MATQGTATLNFGAFPGASDASVAVASAGIGAGSLVEAWIFPAATADHSADEHLLESIKIVAGNVVAGVGFTIYGINTSEIEEPASLPLSNAGLIVTSASAIGWRPGTTPGLIRDAGGKGTRIYGTWNIGWVWN